MKRSDGFERIGSGGVPVRSQTDREFRGDGDLRGSRSTVESRGGFGRGWKGSLEQWNGVLVSERWDLEGFPVTVAQSGGSERTGSGGVVGPKWNELRVSVACEVGRS